MKIIDHLVVKFQIMTIGDAILYPLAAITFWYAYKIFAIVLE